MWWLHNNKPKFGQTSSPAFARVPFAQKWMVVPRIYKQKLEVIQGASILTGFCAIELEHNFSLFFSWEILGEKDCNQKPITNGEIILYNPLVSLSQTPLLTQESNESSWEPDCFGGEDWCATREEHLQDFTWMAAGSIQS